MEELVKVHDGEFPVDARELHQFLQVKTRFNDWIVSRLGKYGFIAGEDFYYFLSKSTGGRPNTDYHLTLDVAKELCMVENNDQGKAARRYFIAVEKRYKEIQQQQLIEEAEREYGLRLQARTDGKIARLGETDAIKDLLIPLIEAQNPTSSYLTKPARVYQNYSRLVNQILGISKGQRDKLNRPYLRSIEMMENAIQAIISNEASKGTPYKEIYQQCKSTCGQIKQLSFLPNQELHKP